MLRSNIKVREIPAEGDWLIYSNLEVGCRCLCWLSDRQPTGGGCLGDAVEKKISRILDMTFAPQVLTL